MTPENQFNEVLLLHNTRFLLRNWLAQKDDFDQKYSSAADQLKAACWNGFVPEILPECFAAMLKQAIFLWDVCELKAFLGLNYSNGIPVQEEKFSLDPYIFMHLQDYN